MSKKPPRAERRARARDAAKLARDRARLAALEPGGAPDRPLEVVSASLVETQAARTSCVVCGGVVRVESHDARVIEESRLRVVKVRCAACGAGRDLYFRIGTVLPS